MESLVESATSESLTAEDWSLIIRICEQAEGNGEKAREIIAAIMKRLLMKNVNVVLYSLTLANALVQNCSLNLKQEIASRPFMTALQKLLSNPKTHAAVKNRILDLVQSWAEAFKGENSLEYMGEIYRQLLSEGHVFPSQLPPSPKKTATMTAKEREEEELQLALAISLSSQQQAAPSGNNSQPSKAKVAALFQAKALYDFNPTEDGELRLRKGDLVDVLDNTTFADWWKGAFEGRIGIFPSNYVSTVTGGSGNTAAAQMQLDPNAELLQYVKSIKELKLLILKADPLGHNHAENEKLQREYEKAVKLVPLVLKRANEQRKKQDDLSNLHEQFTTACATYHGIMNSYSLHRQSTQPVYQQLPQMQYPPQQYPPQQQYPQQTQQYSSQPQQQWSQPSPPHM